MRFFTFSFFHHLNLPGPLTNGLKYFRFWLRIRWVINFERKRRKELSVDIRIRVIASNPADQLGSLRIQIHNTADNKKNKPTRQHNARKPMPTMRQGSIFYILTPPPLGGKKCSPRPWGKKMTVSTEKWGVKLNEKIKRKQKRSKKI